MNSLRTTAKTATISDYISKMGISLHMPSMFVPLIIVNSIVVFSLLQKFFNIGLCQNNAFGTTSVTSTIGSTPAPKFITRGHLYKAIIGDTIILPCKVKDLG
jgi:hypothetical protein